MPSGTWAVVCDGCHFRRLSFSTNLPDSGTAFRRWKAMLGSAQPAYRPQIEVWPQLRTPARNCRQKLCLRAGGGPWLHPAAPSGPWGGPAAVVYRDALSLKPRSLAIGSGATLLQIGSAHV